MAFTVVCARNNLATKAEKAGPIDTVFLVRASE
jgi:hypothetical protein